MEEIELINGSDSYAFQRLGSLVGFEYSQVREVIEDISGPQSSIYITSKFGRRPLSWQSVIPFADRRTLLQACRQQGILKTIKFDTCDTVPLELQAEVEITSVVMPYKNGRSIALIEAIAPDWRFYSQALHTNNSALAAQTIENAGNEKTDPIFRINGPFTAVTVSNLTTSQEFTITHTAIAGEWVEINVKERTIVDQDGTPIFSTFDGEFFNLEPGDNELEFDPTGDSGATALITTWRDAYNGI